MAGGLAFELLGIKNAAITRKITERTEGKGTVILAAVLSEYEQDRRRSVIPSILKTGKNKTFLINDINIIPFTNEKSIYVLASGIWHPGTKSGVSGNWSRNRYALFQVREKQIVEVKSVP